VCSDLLRTNGYARMQTYFENLGRRMNEVGARDIGEWVLLGQGQAAHALDQLEGQAGARVAACRQALEARADLAAAAGPELFARWLGAAKLLNTERYVEGLLGDPRYARAANTKSPPKRGTHLVLFDCLTCDKCIPVCPNDANFTYVLPRIEIPIVKLRSLGRDGWAHEVAGLLRFEKKHQLANFADFCNDCGNCDVFCPEDGGPYLAKPRFFGSREHWAAAKKLDGFFVDRRGEAIDGRFGGKEFHLRTDGARVVFLGEGFELSFSESDPESTVSGTAEVEVDLTFFHILNWLRKALSSDAVNYVNA